MFVMKVVGVFFPYIIVVEVHHCMSSSFCQGNLCTASVDSILRSEDCGLSMKSKGNLLFSAATANSIMDYSRAALDDGEVNSPPAKSHIASVTSPSPLRPRRMFGSPGNDSERAMAGQRVEYDEELAPIPARRSMVFSPILNFFSLVCMHSHVERS